MLGLLEAGSALAGGLGGMTGSGPETSSATVSKSTTFTTGPMGGGDNTTLILIGLAAVAIVLLAGRKR